MITPVLVYDSRERWFPIAVDEALRKIMQPEDMAAFLCGKSSEGTRIDFPRDMAPEWFKDSPPVGYHRIQRGGGLFWHQWWLAYAYNPGPPALKGVGRHEFDWEFAQLGCLDEAGDKPILATGSQHHTGGKREVFSDEDGHYDEVRFYVALGSHANYFTPGHHPSLDVCNGNGEELGAGQNPSNPGWRRPIEWRPFGSWASWSGRWGGSTGEGKSPESPARQVQRWRTPHVFHAAASAQ